MSNDSAVAAPRQIRIPYQSHKIGEKHLVRPRDETEIDEIAWYPQHPISQKIFLVVIAQKTSKLVRATLEGEQGAHETRYEEGSKNSLIASEPR